MPLLVKLPGGRHGGTRIDTPVALLDLAPTLLSILRLPVPDTMQGLDLRPLIDGTGQRAEDGIFSWSAGSGSLQQDQWKIFFHSNLCLVKK